MGDPTETSLPATMGKLKLKIETIAPAMMLFFAVTMEDAVVTPSINSVLASLCDKASRMVNFAFLLRKALEGHTKAHCENRDFLYRTVDVSHLQEATITKFLKTAGKSTV